MFCGCFIILSCTIGIPSNLLVGAARGYVKGRAALPGTGAIIHP